MVCFLTGCQKKGTYIFAQPIEQIDTIEMIDRNYAGTIVEVLKVLDKEKYAQILEDIKELPCYLWWGDPPNFILIFALIWIIQFVMGKHNVKQMNVKLLQVKDHGSESVHNADHK